jgi:hypothetical protein
MRTAPFWNKLRQVRLRPKDWTAKTYSFFFYFERDRRAYLHFKGIIMQYITVQIFAFIGEIQY